MLDAEPEGSKGKKLPRAEYFGRTVPMDPSGRRAWPAELSRRLAEESFNSNLPVERFADEWDVNPSTLSKWRMALLRNGFDPKRGLRDRSPPATTPMFARAVMIEPEPELQPAPFPTPALIVEHAGTTVRLPVGADAELLRLVIFSLRSAG
jgi:transposase-like protein